MVTDINRLIETITCQFSVKNPAGIREIGILEPMPTKNDEAFLKWEHPKKSGIWIREFAYKQSFNGKEAMYSFFQVTLPVKLTGKARKRKQFKTKLDAERWTADQYRGVRKQGEDFFKTTDGERREFTEWMPKLRESGITLEEAAEFALKRLSQKEAKGTFRRLLMS